LFLFLVFLSFFNSLYTTISFLLSLM
jgi:hypothetical protein